MTDPRVIPKDGKRKTVYGTPWWLFNLLHEEFEFTWDVCANAENAKLPGYWTEEDDAFKQEWTSVGNALFMNPPYGQPELKKWLQWAIDVSKKGICVVAVIPANTAQLWFHELCGQASEIRLVKGRIAFLLEDGTPNPRPMGGTAVVVFKRLYFRKEPIVTLWDPRKT